MTHEVMDAEFLAWFAGFVAGEGCFTLKHELDNGPWRAEMGIGLRDDDLPLLIEIQERLHMGRISREQRQLPKRPTALWRVYRIADCSHLVEIFTAHPIRGKKQADFEIWKQAVSIIRCGGSKGGRAPATYDRSKLQYLYDRLRLIRVYRSPDETLDREDNVEEEGTIQLAIWEEEE